MRKDAVGRVVAAKVTGASELLSAESTDPIYPAQ